MSNQRAGKTYRAAATDDVGDRKIRDLMVTCQKLLENVDTDAAFYFEQIVDHINDGKPIPSDQASIARMLGL